MYDGIFRKFIFNDLYINRQVIEIQYTPPPEFTRLIN